MVRSKVFSVAFAVLLFGGSTLTILGQANPGSPAPNLVAANTTTRTSGDTLSSRSQLEQRYPRYVIRREDVLELTFPLTPDLNQKVTVQPDGFINLRNAGSVHAEGLTVPQLVDAIGKAYVGTLHNPIIQADLIDF